MDQRIEIGTSHFVSQQAAILYYGSFRDVERKAAAGEIHIGKPELEPGEELGTCDNGRRYTIITVMTS